MRLFGIAIDDVRDIFGAPPDVAEALTALYAKHYPAPPAKRRWGLFKRDPSLEVDPSRPLPRDVETLLTGGFVEQDRLEQCWELLLLWLEERSATHTIVEYRRLDSIEFDLARRGLSSALSISRLRERSLGIPLQPLPGMRTGYNRHAHAKTMRATLREIDLSTVDDSTRAIVPGLLAFLEDLPEGADVVVVDRDTDQTMHPQAETPRT